MIMVEVRRNSDGVVHRYNSGLTWHGPFIWEEGNFCCNCNRHLFFLWAVGEDEPEDDDGFPCGDSAYSVRITDMTGTELYSDFEVTP